MSDISTKLTYLNGTKSSLKTAINNLGGDIDNNTTFRNYATQLDTIYNNLPKVSDTGTNVSLSPTLKGRLGIVPKGNTYQESTTGKNLFDISTITTGYGNVSYTTENNILTLTATGTQGSQYVLNFVKNVDSSKNYTLSFKSKKIVKGTDGHPRITIRTYGSNDAINYTELARTTNDNPSQGQEYTLNNTFTGYSYYRFYIYNNVSNPVTIGEKTEYYDIQFEEGSSATSYEPYTGGQASPNPDYPQEIQSATGTQKIVVSGKNLFDIDGTLYTGRIEKYNNGFVLTNNSTNRTLSILFPETLPVGTYKITYDIVNSTLSNLNVLRFNPRSLSYTGTTVYGSTSGELTFTTTEETDRLYAYIVSSETADASITLDNFMISTSGGEYQPYQTPQEVDIELSSRNLFDESITPENYSYNSNGVKTSDSDTCINQEINNVNFNSIYVSFATIVGSAYARICEYNSSGTFIKRTLVNSNQSLTLDSNTKKLIFSVNSSSTKHFTNLMINQGNTALDYTPYYNYSPNKIGDYEDYIDGTPDNWVLYKNIGKIVLNGSETWVYPTQVSSSNYYRFENEAFRTNNCLTHSEYLSSNFIYKNTAWDTQQNVITNTSSANANRLWITIDTTLLNGTTINDLKIWLSSHNTEVLYVLSETQPTSITEEPLVSQLNELYYLMSNDDTTNIDVTGNLPMRITASAIKGE